MPAAIEPSRGRALAAVAAGGALGAAARWTVDRVVESAGGTVPVATLAVNIAGCLFMGLLVSYVLAHPARHRLWQPFLGVGVLGGFTTFSAFAADLVLHARDAEWAWALAYLVATVGGSLLAVVVGVAAGRALRERTSS